MMRSSRFDLVKKYLFYIVLFLTYLQLLRVPPPLKEFNLDPSWQLAFGYFLQHRLQAGVDYVFTYGPLGFLVTYAHYQPLFWLKLAWELSINAVFLLFLVTYLRQRKVGILKQCAVLCITSFCVTIFGHESGDAYTYLLFLVIGLCFSEKPSIPLLILGVVTVSIYALVKLTFLPLVALVVLIAAFQWHRSRYPALLSPLLLCAVTMAILWFATGQGIGNIAAYVVGSKEIVTGYGLTMREGTALPHVQLIAATSVLFLVLSFAIHLLQWRRTAPATEQRRSATSRLLISMAVALMAWKHSLVRADDGHLVFVFTVLGFIALLNLVQPSENAPDHRSSRIATKLAYSAILGASLLIIIGAFMYNVRNDVHSPRELISLVLKRVTPPRNMTYLLRATRHAVHPVPSNTMPVAAGGIPVSAGEYPRVVDFVKNGSIDVWSFRQAIVLWKGMNYRPRPAFQGYSSYTPYLQKLNADFYAGPNAPDFILFRMETIDERFPTMDDSLALEEVLKRYSFVFEEDGFLLLQHITKGVTIPPARKMLIDKTIGFDEVVSLPPCPPNTRQFMSLEIETSSLGKLQSLAWKPDTVEMNADLSSGESRTFRIPPVMAKEGFWLNPLVTSNEDLMSTEKPGRKTLAAFRIHTVHDFGAMNYKPQIRVKVWETDLPALLRNK